MARKSPLHLELIGDAWRVRKPFLCPESVQIGCRDFKELLEHDDADIVDAFYSGSKGSPHYACFSDSSKRFFIIDFGRTLFFQNIFIQGQSNATHLATMEWSRDDSATIFTSSKQGKQSVGHTNASELAYQNEFTNLNGAQTHYSVNIRWSTGRFIERFFGKDEKGKPWNGEETGICVELN